MNGNVQQIDSKRNINQGTGSLANLKKPVDPNLIKQREGWRDRNGNTHYVDYVEWHVVADILDSEAPTWTHEVKNISEIGDIITVTVAITIDGVTREGIGTGTAESELGIKKAEHDALKRAAVKFGVGRELYKKEAELIDREGSLQNRAPGGNCPPRPTASGMQDLVTAKQLGMIRAIAREKGVDADEECNAVWDGIKTDILSKKAASYFIQHLQSLPDPGAIEVVASAAIQPSSPVNVPDNRKNVSNFPQNNSHVLTGGKEQVEAMREKIRTGLESVRVNPNNWLAIFDNSPSFEKKTEAYREATDLIINNKRTQIKIGLDESGWDADDQKRYLLGLAVNTGLENALDEQVERIWLDMKKTGML